MNWLDVEQAVLNSARSLTGLGVNWLVQSTLLIAGGLLAGRLLRSRGSAVQSAVYRATLAAVLACPFATLALAALGASGWSLDMPAAFTYTQVGVASSAVAQNEATESPVTTRPESTVDEQSPSQIPLSLAQSSQLPTSPPQLAKAPGATLPTEAAAADNSADSQTAAIQTAPAETWRFAIHGFGLLAISLALAWLAVAACFLTRLTLAWRRLEQIRRNGLHAESTTTNLCCDLAARLRVSPPDVVHSPYVPSPCLTGLRQPAVILPDSDPHLPLRDILIHELAHLRRGDCHWNLLRRGGTAVFWFQPLLWRLSTLLEVTAEEVCDDYVVQWGGDRHTYAHRLVDIAELSAAPFAAAGVGMVSLRSMVARRVVRILDTSRSLSTRVGGTLLALVLIGGLFGTLTAGLVGLSNPASAEANADPTGASGEERSVAGVEGSEPAEDDLVTVRGKVVDPKGKSMPNVDVYVLRWYWNFGDRKPLATTQTDDAGRFEVAYRKSQFADTAGRLNQWRETYIASFADGFGPGWAAYDRLKPGEEAIVKLAVDDVPIEGRVIDLEGRPVPGATIEVGSIAEPKGDDLGEYIAAIKARQAVSTAYATIDESLPHHAAGHWSNIRTDADGRFRVTGLGRERLVDLHIGGPTIVTTSLKVATRRMDPIVHPAYAYEKADDTTQYGARFEYAAAPSRVITGVVRDAESRKPLSGAEIWSWKFAGQNISGITTVKTKSDAEGRYRLEGMPKGQGNEVIVVPTDLPYFTAEFDVDDPPGNDPVPLDIELHRGMWVTGRVTDKTTGKPVSARLHYMAFPDNKLAHELREFEHGRHAMNVQDRYQTDAEGRYRVVALPGHGIIGVNTVLTPYPGGQGYHEIKGVEDRDSFEKINGVFAPSEKFPTAVKEIHAQADDSKNVCDFALDPGGRMTVRAVDRAGKPLSGVLVTGVSELGGGQEEMGAGEFELTCFRPAENRTVLLYHPERRLGKALRVKYEQAGDGALTVELEPVATVTGQLVKDGEPVRGASLRVDVFGDNDYGRSLPSAATDVEGRFRHEAFLPGLKYAILAEGAGMGFTTVAKELDIQPGETVDLGTIDIATEERPEPTRTAGKPVSTQQHIVGRVLDPTGRPLGGAKVAAIQISEDIDARPHQVAHKILAETASDGGGKFELSISTDAADGEQPARSWHVVAWSPGYGPAWKRDVHLQKDKSPTLRLAADQPIRGRLVDLEGNPVAGADVRVQVLRPSTGTPEVETWIKQSREREVPADVTAYFAGATNDRYPNWFPSRFDDGGLAFGSPAMPRATRTDDDGRFEFAGLGADRLAMVTIEGSGIAKSMAPVVTRPMDALQARPAPSEGVRTGTYYGATFEAVAEPTQVIVGKVTDVESGKPLADYVVSLEAFAGYIMSQNNFLTTRTDAQGNYRLIGAPAGGGHRIGINLAVDEPYFPTSKTLKLQSGFEPIECNFQLRRGRWIVGKLTETDGEPVAKAAVEFLPLRDNKFATRYANYDPKITGAAPSNRFHVGKDGSFRVLAIPGAGVLTATAEGNDKAEFMPVNPADLSRRLVNEHGYTNTFDAWTVTGMHAVREVNIDEADDESSYDLQFTRGLTRVLKFVDADGRPVTGASVLGRVAPPNLEQDLKKSTVKVTGLRQDDQRPFVVMHPKRRIGAALNVAPGGDLTVELKPCGVARGRVLDVAGEAHAGLDVNVSINHPDNWSRELLGGKTDKEGRFEVLLPPGIVSRVGRYSMGGPNFSAQLKAQPGDVFELGDLADGAELKTADTAKLKATPKVDSQAAANDSPAAAKTNRASDPLRGQVTGADGKPVKGAKLYWGVWTLRGIQIPAKLAATTDADGNFQFTPPMPNSPAPDSPELILNRMLVVVAPGHGMALTNQLPPPVATPLAAIARAFGRNGASIQLAPDASIKGRIVNVEGEPVVGARVTVHRFDDGKQLSNSQWHAQQMTARGETESVELRARAFGLISQFAPPQLGAVAPSATTDADGRFELAGIGADRMVELLVQRDDVETKLVIARTDPGETIDIKADGNFVLEDQKLYGPDFTLVVGPSKPIEGRVVDVDTGEPLAGAVVRTYAVHGERLSSSRNRQHFATVTDNEGRYRIAGLPLGADNKLVAFTVGEEPYVPLGAVADTSKRESPLKIDFRLKHGAWAEGRAYDADTKAPLAGQISYYILRDPKIEKDMPGLRHAFVDDLYFAGADGRFRVPVFPTRGVLGFRHTGMTGMTNYPRGAGADAIGVTEDVGVPAIPTMTHYVMADNYNALVAVEPKEGERTVKADITLSAGSRITVHPVDEEGQPLSGIEFHGRTEYYSWERGQGPVCEVQGLMPGESRKIVFYDRDRNLAGAAVVDENTEDGLKVTLTPAARLRGRLVNEDGEPLTDVTLHPHLEKLRSDDKSAIWPDDPKLHYNPSNLPIDKEGRFQIVGLIPGWKYTGNVLGTKKMNGAMMRYGFGSAFKDVTLEPGEDRDLGDLVVKTN